MWLLNAESYEMKEFHDNIPEYAVLSHTWAQEEVSFKEIRKLKPNSEVRQKQGFLKVEMCCSQAREDELEWVWIDSCCIDKRSSAELSEAINSMFDWYRQAAICYAYLEDIHPQKEFVKQETLAASRWFTRGWTLQELLAPREIQFYAMDWSVLGTTLDYNFLCYISDITQIKIKFLRDIGSIQTASVATRMSWAANRVTSRQEDRAYSLMGIFNIHMPILYGEGLHSAFERLQREIIQTTSDQSIFAWKSSNELKPDEWLRGFGLLAPSPSYFKDCAFAIHTLRPRLRPFAITNVGVQITLRLTPYNRKIPGSQVQGEDIWLATLRCWSLPDELGESTRLQLFLRERTIIEESGYRVFQRILPHLLERNNPMVEQPSQLTEVIVPSPTQIEHLEIIGTVRIRPTPTKDMAMKLERDRKLGENPLLQSSDDNGDGESDDDADDVDKNGDAFSSQE
jgi:hypothetical protein